MRAGRRFCRCRFSLAAKQPANARTPPLPAALVDRRITSVPCREGQRRAKARHPNIMSEPRRLCSGDFVPAIRSISTRTKRSTKVGRLSSSHDLSIGCSISRTKSSSVRTFSTRTVCAGAFQAECTALLTAVGTHRLRCSSINRSLICKTFRPHLPNTVHN